MSAPLSTHLIPKRGGFHTTKLGILAQQLFTRPRTLLIGRFARHTPSFKLLIVHTFALTVLSKKPETMRMPPPRKPRTMVQVEATGQIYKQVQSFTYLGGTVTETLDIEIARRIRACWMCIKRCQRELYDQPKVALTLETRMVKTKAIEALLYGCNTWTLHQEHFFSNFASYTTGSCFVSSGSSARDQSIG